MAAGDRPIVLTGNLQAYRDYIRMVERMAEQAAEEAYWREFSQYVASYKHQLPETAFEQTEPFRWPRVVRRWEAKHR